LLIRFVLLSFLVLNIHFLYLSPARSQGTTPAQCVYSKDLMKRKSQLQQTLNSAEKKLAEKRTSINGEEYAQIVAELDTYRTQIEMIETTICPKLDSVFQSEGQFDAGSTEGSSTAGAITLKSTADAQANSIQTGLGTLTQRLNGAGGGQQQDPNAAINRKLAEVNGRLSVAKNHISNNRKVEAQSELGTVETLLRELTVETSSPNVAWEIKNNVATAQITLTELRAQLSAPNLKDDATYKKAANEEWGECEKKKAVAEECCAHPERCFTKPDGVQKDSDGISSIVMQLGMTTASVMTANSNSIAAMCGKMKTTGQAIAGINAYLATQCSSYVSQCKKSCEEPAKRLDVLSKDMQYTPPDRDTAYRLSNQFKTAAGECRVFDNQSARLATQAIAAQAGAKLAGLCKDNATAKVNTDDIFNTGDCRSPVAAATPFCIALCNAGTDPRCPPRVPGGPGGPGTIGKDDGFDNNPNYKFDGAGDDEGEQSVVANDIEARPNAAVGGGGSGGGGSGGLAGGGDMGGAAGGAEGGEDAGWDTKIDRGLASGNGYSYGSGLRTGGGGGGFSGYGGGNSSAITNAGKPFSLKDYLPGKDKSNLARSLASAKSADIGPAHGDIFKKVTDRFYQVCLRDALYDCAALQKKKPGI
jgi:hypothetical protein